MRRCLRIAGLIACGLSALLLAATVVLWVRSLRHWERWDSTHFEPRPDWTAPDLAGQGIEHRWYTHATHGRLWLVSASWAPESAFKPRTEYRRSPISANDAEQNFASIFQPGERTWGAGTERAWRFAGAGFRHRRDPVNPRIGRPRFEGFNLALPFWMPAVAFGSWPALFVLRRLRRKKRYAAGLCVGCGYDLRATADPSGPRLARCPECGRDVGREGG